MGLKRSAWTKVGGFETLRLPQDWDFNKRIKRLLLAFFRLSKHPYIRYVGSVGTLDAGCYMTSCDMVQRTCSK